jgi:hypothetical protein
MMATPVWFARLIPPYGGDGLMLFKVDGETDAFDGGSHSQETNAAKVICA